MQRSTYRPLGRRALTTALALAVMSLPAASSLSSPASTSPESLPGQNSQAQEAGQWRLPDNVTPQSYELKVQPDLNSFVFSGCETIVVRLCQPARTITLNAVDLKIGSVTADPGQRKSLSGSVRLDKATERAVLTFPQPLTAGEHRLSLSFSGILNDKLVGFYRSTFTDSRGVGHILAATQMEPTDARRMFPCFDEPALKARFKLTAVVPPSLKAISNAPEEKEYIDKVSGKKIVEFAATPAMSTYLVALLIGDFEATPPVVVEGVPIRVFAVCGKGHLGAYASSLAQRLLPYFNSYFKIPYPWKKLDLIAVPDFEAGAMENPGAITFRESLLLVDEKTAGQESEREVASTIAHEMAHMWFGDLVTMKWWDDLWLNEAFATWMSTRAVDQIMPGWEFWKGYAISRLHALETDSLLSTRPIHFHVTRPSEANEMFDVITYSKGASVLRMLETYVGEDVFQEGVHQYLSKYSYANATTADLWQCIGAISRLPVDKIMHSWVFQPGYPLVSIEPGRKAQDVLLRQKRFLLNPARKPSTEIWSIPFGWRLLDRGEAPTATNCPPAAIKLLEKRADSAVLKEMTAGPPDTSAAAAGKTHSGSIQTAWSQGSDTCGKEKAAGEAGGANAGQPFIANAGCRGYFRVRYEPPLLQSILPFIQTRLGPLERLELLSDQYALMRSGQCPVNDYLEVVTRYKEESDDAVWKSLLSEIDYLDYFVNDRARPAFERFICDQLLCVKNRLGWTASPGESQLSRLVRARVLLSLGTIGQDRQTISKARKLFSAYVCDQKAVDPDLVDTITTIVAFNGDSRDFATFKQLFKKARTPEAEMRNLAALANFRKKELLGKTLALCLSKEVRTQDAPHLLADVMSGRAGGQMAFSFMTANWPKILTTYSQQMVPHMVMSASAFSTESMEQSLKAFFARHTIVAGKSTVARTLETVSANVKFRQRSALSLNAWLEKQYPSIAAGL